MSYSWKTSTRLYAFMAIGITATVVWLFGGAHAKYFSAAMTTDQWTNFMQWIFGGYLASETTRHVAESVGTKQ